MANPTIIIHDVESGEVIERPMTADEFETYQRLQAEEASRKAAEESKIAAKQALLDRLGISADEAALLLQ